MTARRRTRIPRKQWSLPTGIHAATDRLATLREEMDPAVATVPFAELSRRRQADVVAARIAGQRRFRLLVLGGNRVSKRSAIEAVKARTPFGETLIRIEERLIAIVLAETARRRVEVKPPRPKKRPA